MRHSLNMRPFAAVVALLMGGCALMSRPAPETTLLLRLHEEGVSKWPAALQLGSVRANSALHSNRVLVVDNALLMQHAGLRWVDTPAVMLSEQLQMMQTRRAAESADADADAALDVWLTAFQISIDDQGGRTVVVSANAVLRCLSKQKSRAVPLQPAKVSLADSDHASIAKAFADATALMLSSLLEAPSLERVHCGNEPHP